MTSKRILSLAAACAAATLVLAGCGTSSAPTSGESGAAAPATLTLWSRGANKAINQTLADTWNASHETQVKLLAVPDDTYTTKLAAAVAAGNPPDVATLDVATIPQLVAGNTLTDITDRANALPYFSQLAPSYVSYSSKDGRIYALPENVDASTLFWNKDLFKRAGLDPEKPPTNFAELKAAAAKITALGGGVNGFYVPGQCIGCNLYTFSPLAWASGGDYVDSAGTTSALAGPGMVQAMTLYQDLVKSGDVPASAKSDTGANWVSSFGSGKVGMVGLGAFAIGAMKQQFPKVEFGVTTLPGVDGGSSSYTGGDVIAIPRGSKNVDAAWEFVQWSETEEAQVEVYAKSGSLVSRADLIENKYAKDPNIVAENKAVTVGRLPIYVKNSAQIYAANGPFASAFSKIVFEGAPVEQTLREADAKIDPLLK